MTHTAPPAADTTIEQAARDILDQGYAVVKLRDVDAFNLHRAISTAVEFFERPQEDKNAHGSTDHNYGYRPFGIEYSVSPDRPDMNECFTVWASRLDLIPNAADIEDLTDSFLSWRDSLAPIVKAVLDEVARSFGADAPAFEKASYLQINYCIPTPAERDLLQDKHEDGHMVTVLHATAPGLEIYTNDEIKPMLPAKDEIVIMPGSVLTALSGGKIEPLYHQVRNHCLGEGERQSLMYFVNPEIDEPLFGWLDSDEGERVDIREHVQNAPSMFGLPPVEAL
ncbi:MAG: isopenicillin N synthase family oxygenase [Streptomyces sp.]|uniref:2OG-Fe(II) oxygenase family protein n=1 Tax=Streptomyces sp. TaxID=1931 RepID=UPI0025CBF080|nr:2OG-Fe(II) oxygenase family protein [Streptomyces sp.]MBW8802054.1 isopenicillin N synthase family oxygenase [Streptomyces sp.]